MESDKTNIRENFMDPLTSFSTLTHTYTYSIELNSSNDIKEVTHTILYI